MKKTSEFAIITAKNDSSLQYDDDKIKVGKQLAHGHFTNLIAQVKKLMD